MRLHFSKVYGFNVLFMCECVVVRPWQGAAGILTHTRAV